MRKIILTFLFLLVVVSQMIFAQHEHPQTEHYMAPKDEQVIQKLEEWQDLKFGIIIHWGLYAVPGIIESWSVCSEDWIDRDSTISYNDYKEWYFGLINEFNPVKFNPEQWAEVSKEAGMKYLVFTTKHHDGFCLWNTQQTDYSIANSPFGSNDHSDALKYVLNAYRNQGFMVGTYFSKPDWHSDYYWWKKYATPNRNNNYDADKFPWRWNQFKKYTFNQIQELMTGYGDVDILWLDGGWVRPIETVTDEVRAWGAPIPSWSQDIDMPSIANMARQNQPGLLIVDRTVGGLYENYQTPEQRIPDKALDHPWESCITLGGAWGYSPKDRFKPTSQVIRTLVEVVAKGGSLLLGVGPTPEGEFTAEQVASLKMIGQWMQKNGEAIYATRSLEVCQSDNVFFTQSKDHKTCYAIACYDEDDTLETTFSWEGNVPSKGSAIRLVSNGKRVKYQVSGDKVSVVLPKDMKELPLGKAIAFKYKKQ
ncbi:alpha-L-fucosidase [Carboxylicivirga caseinilyticus]|uniref:alpha-L-fucosidase n=1 Tax=Carboxylicivirga caseinilyticus TaxID=3417572 RepID=UPI003D32FC5F|nr:alpha-L-fucosidase [Marinilabiliaceae bacterium A049]